MTASLGVRFYTPTDLKDKKPKNAEDGTYDFHSIDSIAHSFPGDDAAALFTTTTGLLFDEVELAIDAESGIALVTRLYRNGTAGAFEVFVKVGAVDISDRRSKDVLLQINTSIATGHYFYTDGSGLELMERRLSVGPFGPGLGTEPGANYYPVTVLSSIKTHPSAAAPAAQLAWISDRAEGCGSMRNGSLEKMVYRRLLQGDGKGTALSGSICTILTVLSWICVGIHRCEALPSPVCA